jgi:CheY-like chemotaxis protein
MEGVGQVIDVLLVEDDPGEALLVQEALAGSDGKARRCHVAADGDSAVQFLWRQNEFADAPRPRLILLDLNLGAMHGLQILARLKADEQLRTIPVVVLSSSRHPADIHHSYAQQASVYIVKPVDLDDFVYVINVIDDCFLRLGESAIAYTDATPPEHLVPDLRLLSSPAGTGAYASPGMGS